jgi:hypothetical protein
MTVNAIISYPELVSEVIAYPQPTFNILNLDIESITNATFDFVIIDALGRTVIKQSEMINNGSNAVSMNVEGLNKGVYFVKALKDNTAVFTVKFIKI